MSPSPFSFGAGFLVHRTYAVPAIAALWTGIERTHGTFGFAWLVKGETLFKDAAAPDQAVSVEATPTHAVAVDTTAAAGAAPDAPIPATS